MKKLFSMTLAMCFAFGVYAQQAQVAQDQAPNLESHEQRLSERLNLDETQKQQIRSIRNKTREEMKARGMDNREFRQSLRAKTDEQIKSILRPDQLVAYQEIKAEKQERMQGNSIKGKECHGGQNEAKAKSCSGGQAKGCCKKDGGQAQGQAKGCCKKDGAQSQGCSHGSKSPSSTMGSQTNTQAPANR